jgi:hypothetical protein
VDKTWRPEEHLEHGEVLQNKNNGHKENDILSELKLWKEPSTCCSKKQAFEVQQEAIITSRELWRSQKDRATNIRRD